jgi:3-oxoacyl-[acyl-carrier protein] reductase
MQPTETNPLAGRVALVTGASRGLGAAIAEAFLHAGASCALACRSRTDLAGSVARGAGTPPGRALVLAGDLAEPDAPARLVAETVRRFGRLDLLVLNAGETLSRPLLRTSESEWARLLAVNASAPARLLRAALPHLRTAGGGHAIGIGSHAGATGRAGLAAYAAAKAALVGFAKSAAREAAPDGVAVNVVLPGVMPTDMIRGADPAVSRRARRENLSGRLGDPDRVAAFVLTLATLRDVSGQVFALDSRILP